MSEQNKKSGFWSWLGRSKNKDQIQQSIENESIESEQQNTTVELQQVQNEQQNLTEIAVKTTEDVLVEQEQSNEIEDGEQNFFIQEQEKPSQGGFFSRLVKGLLKTKQNIGVGFRHLFTGKKIDDELFEQLEEQLIIADIGMPTATKIINNLTQHASRKQLQDADLLYQQLKTELADILLPVEQPLKIDNNKKPYVILMVGVNGVGKTTTIGKLARQFQSQGKSVMLAAGDTFRAAAVEQLQVWGERNHIPVVAQSTGADSASVIFDAMQSAAAKDIDILIADTAGRLQNKVNLMDELKKIVRVMKKYDDSAPHEIMLTLDAGTGQNAISQTQLFNEAVGLTGISLTKLDGTAKGGVIFAIADQFKLPIRYIGIGEKIEDLRPFQAKEFIDALFSSE
ncbi:signal recognition particle-docking protein FtsY [Seminibacterium arietis]|uniref:Signal recognition particle receptor FtsY n=1 Tax=Seminibacterium arietis TaxID=1173502 RepID=A0ABW3I7S0_9PAST